MPYFNHAATSLYKPEAVYEAVQNAMRTMGNAGRSAGPDALRGEREIYEARCELTKFFGGTDPSGLVFTSGATQSLNTAILGLLSPGDHVITTDMEHNSVLRPLYHVFSAQEHSREEADCKSEAAARGEAGIYSEYLSFLPCDEQGRLKMELLEHYLRPNTRAIVCTHASNLTGNVNDIERIGAFAASHGLLFIVDAAQSAGEIPIDVEKMQISVLCFAGHKGLMGPQGIGGMYVKPGVEVRPLVRGGTGIRSFETGQPRQMPTHLEAGTLNGPGIAGLLAGVREIEQVGMARMHEKMQKLTLQFANGVRELDGITLYGDYREQVPRCPIVALNVAGMNADEVELLLEEEYGISVRSGAHCAPRMHQSFGTEKQGAVRFSFSYYNTEEEVEQAIDAMREICRIR